MMKWTHSIIILSYLKQIFFFFFSFSFFQQKLQAIRAVHRAGNHRPVFFSFPPQEKLQENENLLKILWTSSRKKEEKAQRVKNRKETDKQKQEKRKKEKAPLFVKKWDFESFPIMGTQFGGRKNKRDV